MSSIFTCLSTTVWLSMFLRFVNCFVIFFLHVHPISLHNCLNSSYCMKILLVVLFKCINKNCHFAKLCLKWEDYDSFSSLEMHTP